MIYLFICIFSDFSKLNKDNIYQNNDLAFTIGEQYLGIPALLEAEDMVEYEIPDRLSIITYLAQFFQVFGDTHGNYTKSYFKYYTECNLNTRREIIFSTLPELIKNKIVKVHQ